MKAPLPASGSWFQITFGPQYKRDIFWRSWPRLTPPATTLLGPYFRISWFSSVPRPLQHPKGLRYPCGWANTLASSFLIEVSSIVFLFNPSHCFCWRCLTSKLLNSAVFSLWHYFSVSFFSCLHLLLSQWSQWDRGTRNTWEDQNSGDVEGRCDTHIHP